MGPSGGIFPVSPTPPQESRVLLDPGCAAALENREGEVLFLFPQNLAFHGILFQVGETCH